MFRLLLLLSVLPVLATAQDLNLVLHAPSCPLAVVSSERGFPSSRPLDVYVSVEGGYAPVDTDAGVTLDMVKGYVARGGKGVIFRFPVTSVTEATLLFNWIMSLLNHVAFDGKSVMADGEEKGFGDALESGGMLGFVSGTLHSEASHNPTFSEPTLSVPGLELRIKFSQYLSEPLGKLLALLQDRAK